MPTNLVKVEDKVQLADIVEVLIQHLNKVVDSLQIAEIVVVHVHAYAEVQTRVPSVDYLEVPELKTSQAISITIPKVILFKGSGDTYLDKVSVFGVPNSNDSVYLLNELLFFIIIEIHVPFRQPSLTRTVLNQNEADLQRNGQDVQVI